MRPRSTQGRQSIKDRSIFQNSFRNLLQSTEIRRRKTKATAPASAIHKCRAVSFTQVNNNVMNYSCSVNSTLYSHWSHCSVGRSARMTIRLLWCLMKFALALLNRVQNVWVTLIINFSLNWFLRLLQMLSIKHWYLRAESFIWSRLYIKLKLRKWWWWTWWYY